VEREDELFIVQNIVKSLEVSEEKVSRTITFLAFLDCFLTVSIPGEPASRGFQAAAEVAEEEAEGGGETGDHRGEDGEGVAEGGGHEGG
jgi:hypothetical protein